MSKLYIILFLSFALSFHTEASGYPCENLSQIHQRISSPMTDLNTVFSNSGNTAIVIALDSDLSDCRSLLTGKMLWRGRTAEVIHSSSDKSIAAIFSVKAADQVCRVIDNTPRPRNRKCSSSGIEYDKYEKNFSIITSSPSEDILFVDNLNNTPTSYSGTRISNNLGHKTITLSDSLMISFCVTQIHSSMLLTLETIFLNIDDTLRSKNSDVFICNNKYVKADRGASIVTGKNQAGSFTRPWNLTDVLAHSSIQSFPEAQNELAHFIRISTGLCVADNDPFEKSLMQRILNLYVSVGQFNFPMAEVYVQC